MDELNGFQRDILIIVEGLDRPAGVQIRRHLEDYYQHEVTNGRLYPALDALDTEGLIEKRETGNRSNEYTITDDGKQWIDDRMAWIGSFD